MTNSIDSLDDNVTLNDVKLAEIYYPILIDLAKHKHCYTYGELIERAKNENPDNQIVKQAIPVSTGRKLNVIRLFLDRKNLPDLTSLIINKSTGECGSGFTDHYDPESKRDKVYGWDWSPVSTDFDWFIKESESKVKPRKKVSAAIAKDLMFQYYRANKSNLAPDINEQRELIVELLMEGFSAEEAFSEAVKSINKI
jgi:hypothetical protein